MLLKDLFAWINQFPETDEVVVNGASQAECPLKV